MKVKLTSKAKKYLNGLNEPIKSRIHNDFVIETDLTEEEHAIIDKGIEEYKRGEFVALSDIKC